MARAPSALGLGGSPLYRAIKSQITENLQSGEWGLGEAIPSESRLAERFHVSVGTVRKAVDELVAEKVLVRQQGKGTFVATHNRDRTLYYFFHIVGHDETDKNYPQVELLSFKKDRAGNDAAEQLQIARGDPVFKIQNRLLLAGSPVVLDDITIPVAPFQDLTRDIFKNRDSTIYALYQSRYGINVIRSVERLRANLADSACNKHLGIRPGGPVLEIRRVAYTYHDTPVELRVSRVNTTHHEYLSELSNS
jgi:GntR family transcriptional regulator